MTSATALRDKDGNINFPARTIPLPNLVSPEARKFLRESNLPIHWDNYPAPNDAAGWRQWIAATDEALRASFHEPFLKIAPVKIEKTEMVGVPVYVATPNDMPAQNRGKAHFSIHGGCLILMGGPSVASDAANGAIKSGCVTYSVDYRMPPDHPFPAGLDDCVAVYREIVGRYAPKDIVISGVSAGGNLAAATTLKIRDIGLPLPAAAGLFTPELDLSQSGDSFVTHQGLDVVQSNTPEVNALYANGRDLKEPYISPLYGDVTKGFPPTFLQAGTRDLYLSNAVIMHRALRRAGIEAELHIWEAMPHGGFQGAPEDAEIRAEFGHFLRKYLGTA